MNLDPSASSMRKWLDRLMTRWEQLSSEKRKLREEKLMFLSEFVFVFDTATHATSAVPAPHKLSQVVCLCLRVDLKRVFKCAHLSF